MVEAPTISLEDQIIIDNSEKSLQNYRVEYNELFMKKKSHEQQKKMKKIETKCRRLENKIYVIREDARLVALSKK